MWCLSRLASFSIALALTGLAIPLLAWARSAEKPPEDRFARSQRQHWAFLKIRRPEIPSVRDKHWVRNPIDAFVRARLQEKGVEPSPAADRSALLRRAYQSVIGLPPTPDEAEAFAADHSPGAYEKVVDRLLASPRYGERWARHWLDLARYAESDGFNRDEVRPNAWPYRDYVIQAFNDDKPYDRFVREQIAGDELWPDDPQARLATAFNRHYPDEYNAADLKQRRQEILHDITSTVGATFLGLTFECAACHDHKYDPILQSDYYRLQGFFANVVPADNIVRLISGEALERHRRELREWQEKTAAIRAEMAALENPGRVDRQLYWIGRYSPEVQRVIFTSPAKRTPYERALYEQAKIYMDPEHHLYQVSLQAVLRAMTPENRKRWDQLNADLKKFDGLHPGPLPVGMGIRDAGRTAPPTHVLSGGAYSAPGEKVEPGFLAMLDPAPVRIKPPEQVESTGRRSALADWLVRADNPLTSRVMINRLWHHHFGRGLVDTPSNLGLSGGTPTHPELLDWLASEFMRTGWSMKSMHRLILTSSTFRQSSRHREDAAKTDPDNRLLWRFPRQRLEAEAIRDAALVVSGLLNPEMGGPSVFPPLPAGVELRDWEVSPDPRQRNRRSIYISVRRNERYPMLSSLDMPDTNQTCARRDTTTNATQALTLLNNQVVLEWAEAFAGRVLLVAGRSDEKQIETAYRLAYLRAPDPRERAAAAEFLNAQRAVIARRGVEQRKLALPSQRPYDVEPAEAAALVDLCHMILNSNEFVYRP